VGEKAAPGALGSRLADPARSGNLIGALERPVGVLALVILCGTSVQAYPIPPHVQQTGERNNPRVQAGYLDASLYDGWQGNRLDPTGTIDSTAALQKALDDGYEYGMVTYLPAGEYLVSDTLLGRQIYRRSGCADHLSSGEWGTSHGSRKAYRLVGPEQGPMPVIRLRDNSRGFGNPDNPKPIVYFFNYHQGFNTSPAWQGHKSCGMGMVVRRVEIRTGDNPGAIGVQMPSAQFSILESIKVDASGGFAGIRGTPYYHPVADVEVVGGQYGIMAVTCCGPSFLGVTLRGQTEAAFLADNYGTVNLTGFSIVKDRGPAILVTSSRGHTNQVTVQEGSIRIANGSRPAIHNPGGKDLVVIDVHLRAPGPLIRSGDEVVSAPPGQNHRVALYARPNRSVQTLSDGTEIESFRLTDGSVSKQPDIHLEEDAGDPPGDLVTRHVPARLPSFEDEDAVHARDVGVRGDGTTDDTRALQRAINNHDKVFLPRGDYVVSGTLELRSSTQLFGVCGNLVRFYMPDWEPSGFAPVFRSPDDAQAVSYLGDIDINLPNRGTSSDSDIPDVTYLSSLHWRAGRHSMVRNVSTTLGWDGSHSRSHGRKIYRVSGNGGGRWYAAYGMLRSKARSRHSEFRLFDVDGTHEPLSFYGPNPEHAHALHVEINGASNVRIIGLKGESMSSDYIHVVDSDNVMIAGHTGNGHIGRNKRMVVFHDSTNACVPNFAFYSGQHAGAEGSMLHEANTGGSDHSIAGTDNVTLYTRGEFDASRFPHCGDGYCDPWNEDGVLCPTDCDGDVPICGRGGCTGNETCESCPEDCCPPTRTARACRRGEAIVVDGDSSEWGAVGGIRVPSSRSVILSSAPEVVEDDADCSAQVRASWDELHLYVLVEVSDDRVLHDSDQLFRDDAIEVFLDGLNERAEAYDTNDFQLTVSADGRGAANSPAPISFAHAASQVTGGYAVELAIPWAALGGQAEADRVLGFDIGVNDDDDGGDTRESQLVWNGHGNGWRDPSQFGQLSLVGSGCGEACPDADSDGQADAACGGLDCDDGDSTIHLGAAELCNGADDNCDGEVDEVFDLSSEHDNCGSCGHACTGHQVCSSGECESSCEPGLADCSGACVDLQTSVVHCGSCENACSSERTCIDGRCVRACGPGSEEVHGMCVPERTDRFGCASMRSDEAATTAVLALVILLISSLARRKRCLRGAPFARAANLFGVLVLLAGSTGCGELLEQLPPCEDECHYPLERRCQEDQAALLVCLRNADGCLAWVTRDCPDNAECNSQVQPMACQCHVGTTGSNCHLCAAGFHDEQGTCVEDATCLPRTCSGHGACDDSGGSPICECDPAHEGENCDVCASGYHDDGQGACIADQTCAPQSCSGRGVCDDSSGSVLCQCDPGYAGTTCNGCQDGYHDDGQGACVAHEGCEAQTCNGHGACDDSSGTPTCDCDEGYAGDSCGRCAPGYQDNGQGGCEVITTDGTRFHPGHYVRGTYRSNRTVPQLLQHANRPHIRGAHLKFFWRDLEPSRNNYYLSRIEEALEILQQRGQYLIIAPLERCFGCSSPSAALPRYVIDNGWAVRPNSNRNFWIVRLNVSRALQRWILVLKEVAQLCNSHPHCEGVRTPETAIGGLQGEMRIGTYIDILEQIAAETKGLLPNANHFAGCNFIPNADTTFPALYRYYESIGSGVGWPDTFLGTGTPAHRAVVAFRGILPIEASMEGRSGNASASALYRSAMEKGANYVSWVPWFDGDPYDFDQAMNLVQRLEGAVENDRCPTAIAACVQ
jgi:hypothetical protein